MKKKIIVILIIVVAVVMVILAIKFIPLTYIATFMLGMLVNVIVGKYYFNRKNNADVYKN